MQQEHLRQRIHYLVKHGGMYPEPECEKAPRYARTLVSLIGAVLLFEVIHLILHWR